jgi:flagellar basal-body rod protein FlgC
MSLANILTLAGGALNAQTVRLNTIASNIANTEVVSSTKEQAFRAKKPVFATVLEDAQSAMPSGYGVKVNKITESQAENPKVYDPTNPVADSEGYVWHSNVNPLEEMADMLEASRAFESNLTTASTAQQLMIRTIDMNTK